jgi:hypothetical protein
MREMKTLLFCFLAALSACSTTATLTPISGPMSQKAVRPIEAKIEGIAGNNGKLSFVLADGEAVSGEWIAVNGGYGATKGAGTAHGNRGSVFDIEFECDHSARGIGKATDNRGNTFRVLVRGI